MSSRSKAPAAPGNEPDRARLDSRRDSSARNRSRFGTPLLLLRSRAPFPASFWLLLRSLSPPHHSHQMGLKMGQRVTLATRAWLTDSTYPRRRKLRSLRVSYSPTQSPRRAPRSHPYVPLLQTQSRSPPASSPAARDN